MATDQSSPYGSSNQDEQRVADPGDFTVRRRLRQLHEAKEAVKAAKNSAVADEIDGTRSMPQARERLVAEKLTDFVYELRPLLKQIDREEEFLDEDVPLDEFDGSRETTLREIMNKRGRVDGDNYLTIDASMRAWNACNDYFEQVAGAIFEDGEAGPETNPVDPSGRLE